MNQEQNNVSRYENKVVVVTGGANGIGKYIAETFVQENSKVAICDKDVASGKKMSEYWQEKKPDCLVFIQCDVTSENDIKNAISEVVKHFKSIDCLVNNVGYHPHKERIDDVSLDDFKRVFSINVDSYFLFSKYALPHIRKTHGNVINIASFVGSHGQPDAVTYAATKGAILAMTKAMAIDEAEHFVRVNSISPSNIMSGMWPDDDPNHLMQGVKSLIMGRFGRADEIGKMALFVAADATFSTGADFNFTGGAELSYGTKCRTKPQLPDKSAR